MPQNDFLPVATAGGANVDTQGNFAGSGYQLNGFGPGGAALSPQANKVWRQATFVGAAIAKFIFDTLGVDVLDNGNLASFVTKFKQALASSGGSVVAFNNAANFDCSQASTFQITLTGNCGAPTVTNVNPYQEVTFIIKEDGAGAHTFTAPGNLPLADIDTGANKVNIQKFKADSAGTLFPLTPLTVT